MKHAMSTVNEEDSHKLPNQESPKEVSKQDNEPKSTEPLAASTPSGDKKLPAVPSPVSDHQSLRSASADVLLPLLIFTIVKSNPSNFLSNLRFIQRFRRPSRITGQESYCLTNIMAAVSFLETTNLVGLGLSADKVLSHVTDLNAPLVPPKTTDPLPQRPIDSPGGLKLMSDVMDSSYRVFDGIGRLWQRDTPKEPAPKVMDQGSSLVAESELKDMPSGSVENKESRLRSRPDTGFHALLQAPSQLIHSVHSRTSTDGPLQKFLDKKSVEELKIGEVAELLADYKRLAAIIKQANLS
ncbi:hypothetical protein BJV82DRAFT_312410 [Fennellomyces sp. T-0311]|nr:hypothetical protein BJV82DRAFT_312410 [Fennellomyces sp. T-0311]